jgi:hypothetical protein
MAHDDPLFSLLLAGMYDPDERDRAIFGEYYAPEVEEFEHAAWHMVARIPKTGGDGQPVEIDECRMPARFFRLRALPDVAGSGRPRPAFALTTGSGDEMGQLMVTLGRVIAAGMVGLAADDEVTP